MSAHRQIRESLELLPQPHRERVRALLHDRDGTESVLMRCVETMAHTVITGEAARERVREVNEHFGKYADTQKIETAEDYT